MTAEPVDAAPAPATPEPPLTFRPDVEGLRGVAVLLVLLFHVGLPVPGGFVGVDLFFVISGFLITGLLLREHERTGRVSFGRFYARRIRRLLPAAAVIIVVTLAASMVVVGPLDRPEVMADGAAAALSVVNVRYALAEGDYFAALLRPTPLLHLWSLSVEEQFYLLWPALLFLVARGRRAWVGLTLAIVLAGSFAANLWLTDHTIAWAFYSLPTRAWQLALGGLIAVAATALRRIPWPLLAPAGWIGLGAIGASAILLGATPYPGVYALAPTIGGVLLIAAGEARLGPGRLLSIPPLRWVGRISYSLYLWHWPILVLAPVALRAELPLEARIGLGVVAIGVAWLSWRFVEEPFRHGRLSVVLGTRRALATGLATVALVAVAATGLQIGSLRAIDAIAAAEPVPTASPASFSTPAPSDPEPSPTPSSGSSGAPSVEPSTEPSAEPSPTPAPTPDLPPLPTWREIPNEQPAAPIPLVAGIRPSLSDARTDSEPIYRDGCGARVDDLVPQECVYGDRSGAFTIALVGDSSRT
jgi:peptidoglycan/LPS O-acetylase OafA/YrhL